MVLTDTRLSIKEATMKKTVWLPGGAGGKESACQCRRRGFDPWVRKKILLQEGNPIQYSYLIAQLVKNLPAMQENPV